MAVNHYKKLLARPINHRNLSSFESHFPAPTEATRNIDMTRNITEEEIKEALFSIPDDKAPGPDGFTSKFYKQSWTIIKRDFIAAIRYFFYTLTMPKYVNATYIALVPKVENPGNLNDYRPISCCTVWYKCIAKILVTRLKPALEAVISPAQTAFLSGRSISDAILLSQELLHNYHNDQGTARVALKIDLRKAFDSINWNYIIAGMVAIGIPATMISWIEKCITTPHFSVSLNGELHGFFPTTKGLRQGDPLSPYLFVLAMEGLSGIIRQRTAGSGFRYHRNCKATKLTHICFADDLMLFCHGDITSIATLKEAVGTFTACSGLHINSDKSSLYMSGVSDAESLSIQAHLNMTRRTLPVKYLGVPLITTRLTFADCLPLLNKITTRRRVWTSKSLSYGGRLQLIKSVLFSYQVYWSSLFILPASVVSRIESTLSAFLWKGSSLQTTGAKVAWETICYPTAEGGLGIKQLAVWNKAAMLKHLWRLITDKSSLWTAWAHINLLKGNSIWAVSIPSRPSWAWRKILQSREICRCLITTLIGDGTTTSLWNDYWLPHGQRISDILPHRIMASSGLGWDAKVSTIINGDYWSFPNSHNLLSSLWTSIASTPNSRIPDRHVWGGHPSGKFTISSA